MKWRQATLQRHLILETGLIVGFALSPVPSLGQAKEPSLKPSITVRAGISISENYGTKELDSEYTVKSHRRSSITGGVSLYLPVTSRFGLQHELFYVRKGSRQEIGVEILEIPTTLDVTYDLNYIEIPTLIRYTWKTSAQPTIYGISGFALSLKTSGRYTLSGQIEDDTQVVPLKANSDMREVDMFDYSFIYGFGSEFLMAGLNLALEYRFTIGWNELQMPTYAYIPVGDDEVLIDNRPVPLRNQCHCITVGYRF